MSSRCWFSSNLLNLVIVLLPDNRPVPKPHFAAVSTIQPPAPKPAPAVLQAISTTGSSSGRSRSRPSLVPGSRLRRPSIGGANVYQSFAIPSNGSRRATNLFDEKIPEGDEDRSGNLGLGLSDKDINDRVSSYFATAHLT